MDKEGIEEANGQWHGNSWTHQDLLHCSLEPFRPHPWCSRGDPLEVQATGDYVALQNGCVVIGVVFQAHEDGVHRGQNSGMHGREKEGVYSIAYSGGYEGDADEGEEFTFSGCGGRNLSGNKRTAKQQSWDQKLTRANRALARNCDAPIDDKKGGLSKNWKNGKPVRVVSNCFVSQTCHLFLWLASHPQSGQGVEICPEGRLQV